MSLNSVTDVGRKPSLFAFSLSSRKREDREGFPACQGDSACGRSRPRDLRPQAPGPRPPRPRGPGRPLRTPSPASRLCPPCGSRPHPWACASARSGVSPPPAVSAVGRACATWSPGPDSLVLAARAPHGSQSDLETQPAVGRCHRPVLRALSVHPCRPGPPLPPTPHLPVVAPPPPHPSFLPPSARPRGPSAHLPFSQQPKFLASFELALKHLLCDHPPSIAPPRSAPLPTPSRSDLLPCSTAWPAAPRPGHCWPSAPS